MPTLCSRDANPCVACAGHLALRTDQNLCRCRWPRAARPAAGVTAGPAVPRYGHVCFHRNSNCCYRHAIFAARLCAPRRRWPLVGRAPIFPQKIHDAPYGTTNDAHGRCGSRPAHRSEANGHAHQAAAFTVHPAPISILRGVPNRTHSAQIFLTRGIVSGPFSAVVDRSSLPADRQVGAAADHGR